MFDQPSTLTAPLAFVGRHVLAFIDELGAMAIFFSRGMLLTFSSWKQIPRVIHQVFFIGVKSVSVISLIGIFTGMVMGLQGYYTLVKFGSEGMLGAAVALTIIRELGPVLTAIMITGRAGSSMSAEIGIMRISEQIDALEVMDINPMSFLISPRLSASIISFPLLTALFDVLGIIGGYLTGVVLLGINSGVYFHRIGTSVELSDVIGGFAKSLAFAVIVSTVCCFQGYFTHTRPGNVGPEGVSNSTTAAVVLSCVLILVSDYVLTSFLL